MTNCWTQTCRRMRTAGTSRSHAGASGAYTAPSSRRPSAPNRRCQRLPLVLTSRQAVAVEPGGILVDPRRVCLRAQPRGCHQGERVERVAQGFSHTLQAIERSDLGQHMRRVGPLPAACGEQLERAETVQHRVEQQHLRSARHQPGTKLAQHRAVEASIGQLQAEAILPIDAAAHGIGCLLVREPFHKLQDRDQRQAPRRRGGLAADRKHGPELLIPIQDPHFVAHAHY